MCGVRKMFSHIGWHQGCCLATFGAVVGYHEVMREVCREYKHVTGLCDADDTILHGQQATAAFRLKVKLQRERCRVGSPRW